MNTENKTPKKRDRIYVLPGIVAHKKATIRRSEERLRVLREETAAYEKELEELRAQKDKDL